MTKQCAFDTATGLFVAGVSQGDPRDDPANQALIELPDYPDRRTERWDGADGIRPATAQEIADYDEAEAQSAAVADIDGLKALKALAVETLIEINALRSNAGMGNVAPADWRQRLIDRYKGF
jgi:hypothetical protein